MNLKTFSIGIVAVLVATMLSVLHVQAAGACSFCECANDCPNILMISCNSVQFSLPGADDFTYEVDVFDPSIHELHSYNGSQTGGGTVSVSFSAAAGDFLNVAANDSGNNLYGIIFEIVVPSCSASGAVTWFTPGDARVSGHPGDQIAVYCNKATATSPANIDVWGIINSDGFSLTKVNVSDIVKSGAALKDGKGGTVFLGGSGGYFFAAWVNGAFGANGQNSFVKTFSCTF